MEEGNNRAKESTSEDEHDKVIQTENHVGKKKTRRKRGIKGKGSSNVDSSIIVEEEKNKHKIVPPNRPRRLGANFNFKQNVEDHKSTATTRAIGINSTEASTSYKDDHCQVITHGSKQKSVVPVLQPPQKQNLPCDFQAPEKHRFFDPITKQYVKIKKNRLKENTSSDTQCINRTNAKYNNKKHKDNQVSTNNTKNHNHNEKNAFPPHYISEMVESALKKGLLIEGILRINPKAFEDAFISSNVPNELDIYIGGIMNRNRALNGDEVVVDLLPECQWKVNNELIQEYLEQNDLDELPCSDIARDDGRKDHDNMVKTFKRLGVRFNSENTNEENSFALAKSSDVNSICSSDYMAKEIKSGSQCSNNSSEGHIQSLTADNFSTSSITSKGVCTPTEKLKDFDFEVLQENCDTTNVTVIESDLDSSEEVDILVDEIVDIGQIPSKRDNQKQTCHLSVNDNTIREDNNPEGSSKSTEVKRTRRKRGSKKKKLENGNFII